MIVNADAAVVKKRSVDTSILHYWGRTLNFNEPVEWRRT
jgi:hypothetical protein